MNKIIKISALAMALSVFAGCDDADYQSMENGLYINEAASTTTFNQQVEDLAVSKEMTVAIHLRVARPADKDIKATIGLAPEFMEKYNAEHGTSYQILPEEFLKFDPECVISAGSTTSGDININIKPFSTPNGEVYCIPLKVISADTDVQIMEATSRIMYLLTGPLIQKVPMFNRSQMPKYKGDNWGIGTDEWTLEAWFNMDQLGEYVGYMNNQALFSVACSEGTEIYVRFGDAAIAGNILQIKTGGSQFELKEPFETGKWYHFALTYSASGEITAYINGEKAGGMTKKNHYVLDNILLCGSESYFRAEKAMMSQVRLWSVCRQQSTIQANMNRGVDPNSSGLIGYWKLDEGEGDIFKDATPNKFNLECSAPVVWSAEDIDFTDPNKEAE